MINYQFLTRAGTATGRMTVRFAARGCLLAGGLKAGARAPDDEAVDIIATIAMR
jgi:hypothetical protein